MITVAILINGKPIYARTCVNRSKDGVKGTEVNKYLCDDGKWIKHVPKDGAVALAKKMLDTIKEVK